MRIELHEKEVKAEAAFTQMTWRFDPLGETALAL